jgi:hypothetical protein
VVEEGSDRAEEVGDRVEGFFGGGEEGGEDEQPDEGIAWVEGDLGDVRELGHRSWDGLDGLGWGGIHHVSCLCQLMNPVKDLGDPGKQGRD